MKYFCYLMTTIFTLGLFAHEDDPKVRDRVPPYNGPGFRLGQTDKIALDFPTQAMTLLSWVPLNGFGSQVTTGNDCWGYTSPSGREYAIIGLSHGTGFVEISNPAAPVVLSTFSGEQSIWRDVKVYGHFAYAVTEGSRVADGGTQTSANAIQVFDLSRIDEGSIVQHNWAGDGTKAKTHNVAIDTVSGFLYRAGGRDEGLRIYSLADPTNPTLVARWTDKYVHDTQVVTYTSGPYAGRQIAFACAGFNGGSVNTGLSILDVTNKANIQVLAHYEYPNAAYSHQGWLSPDRRYFYLNDEADEITFGAQTSTKVLDVSDLSNPFQVSTFTSGTNAIDHNLYTRDHLIFEANYRSGLRVFDATNPTAPEQVAYFDTWVEDDDSDFNGAWSSYCYFPSGNIILSDLEKGLFVLRLDYVRPQLTASELLFPWVSNSDTYESTIHINNYGTTAANLTFSAKRANGETETTGSRTIPARGFLEVKASELFPTLGRGNGYTVVSHSDVNTLTGRWLTFDRVASSPSQGMAIELVGSTSKSGQVGTFVNLGSLPANEMFTSAPVLVNVGTADAQVTVYYFGADGELIDTDVTTLSPKAPWVPRVLNATTGSTYAVASSSSPLTGVAFTFSPTGQTAIGGATAISSFIAP